MNHGTDRSRMWTTFRFVRLVLNHSPVWLLCWLLSCQRAVAGNSQPQAQHFDVIVCSSSPAGAAAAVAASSRGCSVLLAELAEAPPSLSGHAPGITVLQHSRIAAVFRSPDFRRITAVSVRTHQLPDTSATPAVQTFTCGFVIDASVTGDVLQCCGDVRPSGLAHNSPLSKSRLPDPAQAEFSVFTDVPAEFPVISQLSSDFSLRTAVRLRGLHTFSLRDVAIAHDDARAVLHCDSIACSMPHFEPAVSTPPYQVPWGILVPRYVANLLVPVAVSASDAGLLGRHSSLDASLGLTAGFAAAHVLKNRLAIQDLYLPALQQQLTDAGIPLIHVSDVPAQSPDFAAVQWWGLQGGLHGLAKADPNARPRSPGLLQLTAGTVPGHAADLQETLSPELAKRWQVIALIAGIPLQDQPPVTSSMTRADFVRHVWSVAMRMPPTQSGHSTQFHAAPRINPAALSSTHPPGEVDNAVLASFVIRNADMLPGIVVDDCDAELQGDWQYSTHTPPYVGRGYLHDMNAGKGKKSATYRPHLPTGGWYEVRLSHCRNIRRSTNTLVIISHADGQTSLRLNQQLPQEHGQLFRTLGRFRFNSGREHWVKIANDDTTGKYVIADAIQWIPTVAER